MSTRKPNPGRILVVFFLAVALTYGLVALAGVWKPKLGLDLQGGTRITLVAQGDAPDGSLAKARGIIESRVDASGVAEAKVSTQGNQFIVVEIPGESRRDLVETVKRQALLSLRVVATSTSAPADTGGAPADKTKEPDPETQDAIEDPLTWMDNPDAASLAAFDKFSCPAAGEVPDVDDDPAQPLITCDGTGQKLLLSAALIESADVSSVSALPPSQQNVEWGIDLDFNRTGTEEFARLSRALVDTGKQFAVVLDSQVISTPTMDSLILDGNAQITGRFTEAEARSLATSLEYGALPISFEQDPAVELVGPSLAGNQLSAGINAGIAGLVLVMLYCLLYFRALGLVVIASLVVAAALTYSLVVLLSEGSGFTLSLPGIAGLIVAVGITADSFVVYFERIRDEMRGGRSLPLAVEAAWLRARRTCLAADAVVLLAAVVLYVFATGVVQGFAFALGLATLVDLVVFFGFTHPMVSWLARLRMFSRGHRLSGLSADSLGLDAAPTAKGTI